MRGLLKALAYIHGFGVMHRDIKLQNIVLMTQDSWEPVLVDFGLAAISEDQPYHFYRCGIAPKSSPCAKTNTSMWAATSFLREHCSTSC